MSPRTHIVLRPTSLSSEYNDAMEESLIAEGITTVGAVIIEHSTLAAHWILETALKHPSCSVLAITEVTEGLLESTLETLWEQSLIDRPEEDIEGEPFYYILTIAAPSKAHRWPYLVRVRTVTMAPEEQKGAAA